MSDSAVAARSPPPTAARAPLRRSGAALRIEEQPGFVLHTYPWRESSLIVEALTRDHGRVALVARGAKRPTSQFRGLLSPFCPLQLSWSGRNDIKSLTRVEWGGGLTPLRGGGLLAAFYLNELLVRLLARGDPHEALFLAYARALHALARHGDADVVARATGRRSAGTAATLAVHEPVAAGLVAAIEDGAGTATHTAANAVVGAVVNAALRTFEVELLREAGWLPPLDRCADGDLIVADAVYRFDQGRGIERVHDRLDELCVGGSTIQALALRDFGDVRAATESKTLLRQMIRCHLNGQPLNTRRIFHDLKQL
jgi:DNA repair protein RecO (recombination protein O)